MTDPQNPQAVSPFTDPSTVPAVPAAPAPADPLEAAASPIPIDSPVPADPTSVPEPMPVEPPVAADAPTPAETPSEKTEESPLDMLDKILKEAQQKAGATQDQDEEKRKTELAVEEARQREEDLQKIAEAEAGIEAAKQSPENLARVEQEEGVKSDSAAHDQQMSGLQIVQLAHKKIDLPTE